MAQDEKVYQGGEDDGVFTRIRKSISDAIFGSKDVNLPDENPDKGTPRDADRVRKHEGRKFDHAMETMKDFGRRMEDAGRAEKIKKLKAAGLTEEEATRKALGRD